MKTTQWFSPQIRPLYPGAYEVRQGQNTHYRYWDGQAWYEGAQSPEASAQEQQQADTALPWRGLSSQPVAAVQGAVFFP